VHDGSRPIGGGALKLLTDLLLHARPVPPRADGEIGLADSHVLAVMGDAEVIDVADPARDFLTRFVALVQVVVARTENHARQRRQPRQIFPHDNDLRMEIDDRSDIQRVAGDDDDVEMRRCAEQPVELRQ